MFRGALTPPVMSFIKGKRRGGTFSHKYRFFTAVNVSKNFPMLSTNLVPEMVKCSIVERGKDEGRASGAVDTDLRQSRRRPIPPGCAWDYQIERSTHVEAKIDLSVSVIRDDDICLIEQLEIVCLTDELGKLWNIRRSDRLNERRHDVPVEEHRSGPRGPPRTLWLLGSENKSSLAHRGCLLPEASGSKYPAFSALGFWLCREGGDSGEARW